MPEVEVEVVIPLARRKGRVYRDAVDRGEESNGVAAGEESVDVALVGVEVSDRAGGQDSPCARPLRSVDPLLVRAA